MYAQCHILLLMLKPGLCGVHLGDAWPFTLYVFHSAALLFVHNGL